MFLRKNTAGQTVAFCLVNASTGAALTGATVAVRRCLDGTFAAGGGAVTEDAGGLYKFAPSQADTSADQVAYYFTAAGAVPVCLNLRTTAADMSDGGRFGLTALPNAAAGASGGLPTGDASGRVTVGTNADKSGYSLAQAFPANFASLAVNASGHVVLQDASLVTAKLGTFTLAKTTHITGFNDIAATAVVSGGAITTSGGAVASVTAVTNRVTANTDRWDGVAVTGMPMPTYAQPTGFLAATFPASVASPTNITAGTLTTVTNLTNLPAVPSNWLTAAGIAAGALTGAVWDEAAVGHTAAGTFGGALAAAGGGDPWATSLPGAYPAGTAGSILGNRLDAAVSTRSTFAGGAVASVTGAVGSVAGDVGGKVLGGGAGAITGVGARAVDGSGAALAPAATALSTAQWTNARAGLLDNLDAAVSGRLAAAAYTAPDNAGIATAAGGVAVVYTELGAVKAVTDKLDTALEFDGASYRYTTDALEQAPSGGGGGTDWTADERAAIRAILGVPPAGGTPADPSAGILDAIRGAVAAVKAKTDDLTFTTAGQVDANVRRMNSVPVIGTGTGGDRWRA